MAHIIDTPRTDAGETHIAEGMSFAVPEFSAINSFASPSKGGRSDLLHQMRPRRHVPATPSQRQPLASLRQPQAKAEFTPLLKSATKKAFMARHTEDERNGGLRFNAGPETPAALRPDFRLGNTPLPEPSDLYEQQSSSEVGHEMSATPVPPVASSSALSTPLAMPRRGPEGMLDSGNALTLREQEAKLAQIDKENFGLKLKIHYLEENLQKSGPEYFQNTVKENSQLKADTATLQLELRNYRKSMKQAEHELEQYRQQLKEYAEKMKKRHMDEAIREELEELRGQVDDRAAAIDALHEELDAAKRDNSHAQKATADLEDLEAELRAKDNLLEQKEDELEALEARLRTNTQDIENELDEKERYISEQEDRIIDLQEELRNLQREKENDDVNAETRVDKEIAAKDAEIASLSRSLDDMENKYSQQEREFDERSATIEREKHLAIQSLERRLNHAETGRQDEIDSLRERLVLAESQGDNQTQLAQQAANAAHEQLRLIVKEKDGDIETLTSKLEAMNTVAADLEVSRDELRKHDEKEKSMQAAETAYKQQVQALEKRLALCDKELESHGPLIKERASALQEVDRLRQCDSEREQELETLRETLTAQSTLMGDVHQLRSNLSEKSRLLEACQKTLGERTDEMEALRKTTNEPDSRLEAIQTILGERDCDLEELRTDYESKARELDNIQHVADERLGVIQELQEELRSTKQDLEDEIQVLVDDAEETKQESVVLREKIRLLESQGLDAQAMQDRIMLLERDSRTAEREKLRFESTIKNLESEIMIADQDRKSLRTQLEGLKSDLNAAQPSGTSVKALADEREQLHDLLKASKLEAEELCLRVREKESVIAKAEKEHRSELTKVGHELEAARLQSAQKESELKTMQTLNHEQVAKLGDFSQIVSEVADLRRQIHSLNTECNHLQDDLGRRESQIEELTAGVEAMRREAEHRLQSAGRGYDMAQEDAMRLREELMTSQKRHLSELKGLAKQIEYLSQRIGREEEFREGLSWQKRWFLLTIGMYGICNKASLDLIAEMGITPDASFRQRRPSLKAVGSAVIATIRMRKKKDDWAKCRRVHEGLVKKLENMRRGGGRRSAGVR